ncbi:uncharacterized protein LOC126909006 [Daktulosphaira vitifoliae]|uniref:uncharacterized protein LOC126909006 n=1 Tax=Daktulosphaira vitifoliae TaxID=58002 RepID=UPI0021A9D81A|nr:uncharacterized protein LOC126909006 [Daktulosphaira vitifoliae]
MYLRFQIILSFGLIFSSSALINLAQVSNFLSSNNLPQAQNAFHNCIANLKINGFEQRNYDEINQYLSRLRDDIISRKIKLEIMSEKIAEFLNLDISNIEEKFEECCTIFHETLFRVENVMLKESDNLEIFRRKLTMRFNPAYEILQECIKKYSLVGNDTTDLDCYSKDPSGENFHDFTIRHIFDIVSGEDKPDFCISYFKNYIFNDNVPFSRYCCAVYYTYLVLDDSTLNQDLGTSDRTQ